MRKRAFLAVAGLVLATLIIGGCRFRSAGRDKEPTPPGVRLALNTTGTPTTPTQEIAGATATATATATVQLPTSTPTTFMLPTSTPTATATLIPAFPSDTPTSAVITGVGGQGATEAIPPIEQTPPTAVIAFVPSSTPTTLALPTSTATNTPPPTATATWTPSPSPSNTLPPLPTNTPTPAITSTFTPFPTLTLTLVVQQPAVVAQQPTPTILPQLQTATAIIYAATATAGAQLGTLLPQLTPGQGGVQGITPTQLYPDCEYLIQPGDKLGVIAQTYNMTTAQLAAANNITNPNYIKAGDRLRIPGCGRIPTLTPTPSTTPLSPTDPRFDNTFGPIQYVVQAGDNIYKLSVRFGVTMRDILNANPRITDINVIVAGETLTIPTRTQPLTPQATVLPPGPGTPVTPGASVG